MNYLMDFLFLVNQKNDSYDAILIVTNRSIKMMYYEPVKTTINIADLVEVIINVVIRYYSLSELIINNQSSLFMSKFQLLLYYFFSIKQKLFNAFHSQIDDQIKRQYSIIEFIFIYLSIGSQMIRQDSCPQVSLCITM